MLNLPKKFLLISIVLVILVTFAFTLWSASLSQKDSLQKIAAIVNSSSATPALAAQTYQAAKAPIIKEDDWILGDKNNTFKIFVYEDYANIYSANLAATLNRLASDYPDITFIFRPFIAKNNSLSTLGAQAMICAGDKWGVMRENIFKLVRENKLAAASLTEAATQNGFKTEDFNQCLASLPSLEKSAKLSAEVNDYSVQGAPTMFINNNLIVGARPYDDYTDSNGDKISGLKTVI
ncbi:MAG: thioredoxin domain-containing protein, partial [Candidatus Falkowbacteria bacterium]|nr:thioredoxin domain-containing protein [Candidatus Falkowbacteria bacterium]